MTYARSICLALVLAVLGFASYAWFEYASELDAREDALSLLEVHQQLAQLSHEVAQLRKAALMETDASSARVNALIEDIDAALARQVGARDFMSSWSAWKTQHDELHLVPPEATSADATVARMKPFSQLTLLNEHLEQIASGLRFELFRQWQPGSDAKVVFELTLAASQRVADLAAQVEALNGLPGMDTPAYFRLGELTIEVAKIARFYAMLDVDGMSIQPPAIAPLQAALAAGGLADEAQLADATDVLRTANQFAEEALLYAEALVSLAAAQHRQKFIGTLLGALLFCLAAPGILLAYERQQRANAVTRNQLANAFAGLEVGSWTRDMVTNEVKWSPELRKIFGMGPAMADRHLTPLVHEDDRDEMERRLSVLLTAPIEDPPVRQQFDIRIYHPSGEARWVSSVVAKTRLENGNAGLVGVLIDTHERHMTETRLSNTLDALARRNEELNFFARSTAHDLMEPVRVAHAFAQMLAEENTDTLCGDSADYLQNVLEATGRAKQTLSSLREYLSIGSQGEPVAVDLDAVVGRALRELKPRIEASGAVIEVCALPRVMGQPASLQKVFFHVLDNAIHYTPDEIVPRVVVSATCQGAYLHVEVLDSGIGMDAEHLEMVFRPFHRLHSRASYAGVGLGLSLSRRAVEFAGGRMWLESTVDEGSRIHIELPLAVPEAAQAG